ncbi:MAG: hypothetical protein JWR24_906 [Actinoallomurus sp.]|nr:hypothetical protein [Actinoallomurus sp.]
MASRTPCAGQPYAAVVPPNYDQPGAGHTDFHGAMAVVGGKIFASSAPLASSTGRHAPALGCLDPGTRAACAGWSTPHTFGAGGSDTYNAFVAYDSGGHAVGACATAATNGPPHNSCFAIDGSALAAPGFGSIPAPPAPRACTAGPP